jgi:hypothetical protein
MYFFIFFLANCYVGCLNFVLVKPIKYDLLDLSSHSAFCWSLLSVYLTIPHLTTLSKYQIIQRRMMRWMMKYERYELKMNLI